MGSPHDLGKHVAKNMVKNGMASGWACLLANSKKCTGGIFERGSGAQLSPISPTPHRLLCASLLRRCTGGIFGDTFKKIYDSIDVLIGGGPLILDKSTGCAQRRRGSDTEGALWRTAPHASSASHPAPFTPQVRRVQTVQVQPHRADLHLLRHRLRQHRRHRPEPRPPPRPEGVDGRGGEGVRRRARACSFGGEIEQPRSLSRPTHL